MNLLFITRESKKSPGAMARCYSLISELKNLGITAQVLSFADDLGALEGKDEHKMGITRKLFFNLKALARLLKEKKDTIFFIQRSNYHCLAPLIAHIIKGNQFILDIDDWETRENIRFYFGFLPNSLALLLLMILARRSKFVTTPSVYLKDFLAKYSNNVYVLKNSVDVRRFSKVGENYNKRNIVFSWIGTMHRLDNVENIEFLVRCFGRLKKKHNDIRFDIVGDGVYLDRVKRLREDYGDNSINFKGWINHEHIPNYLNTIDIGLCPLIQYSKFNLSKSPVKLLEYMAAGKPSISSKIGQPQVLINDGENGFLARDEEEFVEKMDSLINDGALRESIGQNAHDTVRKKFTVTTQAENLHSLINDHFFPLRGQTPSNGI